MLCVVLNSEHYVWFKLLKCTMMMMMTCFEKSVALACCTVKHSSRCRKYKGNCLHTALQSIRLYNKSCCHFMCRKYGNFDIKSLSVAKLSSLIASLLLYPDEQPLLSLNYMVHLALLTYKWWLINVWPEVDSKHFRLHKSIFILIHIQHLNREASRAERESAHSVR